MTRKQLWQTAFLLIGACVALSVLHIAIFRAPRDFFLYLQEDLAFLPLEVLIVTVVLNQMLTAREREERARKLNMVIGAFFSSLGYDLLGELAPHAAEREEIGIRLALDLKWTPVQMREAIAWCEGRTFQMTAEAAGLARLKTLLATRQPFLLNMLENPMLLEHEVFTDCLWAVSHLSEELAARCDLTNLPAADLRHLAGDMERAYTRLQVQWLHYMIHLHRDYPYLFSFAARTNPLRAEAQVEITE